MSIDRGGSYRMNWWRSKGPKVVQKGEGEEVQREQMRLEVVVEGRMVSDGCVPAHSAQLERQ